MNDMEPVPLPHPADHSQRDVLIYDGDCRFCLQQVTKLANWDSQGRLSFLPLQDPYVSDQYPDLDRDELMKEMLLITTAGDRYRGVDAAREIVQHLPPLRWLKFWFGVPGAMSISRVFYRIIARWRYRIWGRVNPCDHGTCDIHFRD
jgi:predicted DCC family thiol-disulfide oxidoreductase YuxK